MEEDSHDGGADCARTRFVGSVEEVADALQMRTPADIKNQDELRVGQTSIPVNTVLLSAQGHRLRRLFALWPDFDVQAENVRGCTGSGAPAKPVMGLLTTPSVSSSRGSLPRGSWSSAVTHHKPSSAPDDKLGCYAFLFTNPLSWEIDDQAGLDEGE